MRCGGGGGRDTKGAARVVVVVAGGAGGPFSCASPSYPHSSPRFATYARVAKVAIMNKSSAARSDGTWRCHRIASE